MQPPQVPSAGTTPLPWGMYSLFNGIAHQDNSSPSEAHGSWLGICWDDKTSWPLQPLLSPVSGELAGVLPRQDPSTTSTPIGQNNRTETPKFLEERRMEGRHGPWLSLPSCSSFSSLASCSSEAALPPGAASPLDLGLCPSRETFCKWTPRIYSSHCRQWDGRGTRRWGEWETAPS